MAISEALDSLLAAGDYDFIFTLLPSGDGHGHHKAAALLALEAVSRFPQEHRPIVLAVEAEARGAAPRVFEQLEGHPQTRTSPGIYAVSRRTPTRSDANLTHQVISNWVIASHRSQGMLQMDYGVHDLERFWTFETNHAEGIERARTLFEQLGAVVS